MTSESCSQHADHPTDPRNRAAIAFGSNLGDRAAHLATALARLECEPGVAILARSTIRETRPVGGPPQGDFLNSVVLVETRRTARELLTLLQQIEAAGGRVRREHAGPRTIDLDLILFGDQVVDEPDLTIPHPRAHQRRFVLEPLAEVAADWVHPTLRLRVSDLLARCHEETRACHA